MCSSLSVDVETIDDTRRVNIEAPRTSGAAMLLSLVSAVVLGNADCEAVRRTLELLRARRADEGAVLALEQRVCSATNEACADATALWFLSMSARSWDAMTTLDAVRTVACARADDGEPLSWSSQSPMRLRSGTWLWPSGTIAKTTSGTWSWPSGAAARSSTGTLHFPSGAIARASTGRWSTEKGRVIGDETAMVAAACQQRLDDCRAWMAYLPLLSGPARDAALLGLALLVP